MNARSLLLIAVVTAPVIAGPAESDIALLEDIRVDFHLATKHQREAMTPSLLKQLSVVKAANLPTDVVSFVHSITIVIDPSMLAMQTNGEYVAKGTPPFVRIKPIELPEDRAIVLHELMHAYRHQILKEYTPDIIGAYRRAQLPGVYPDDYRNAAFLTNAEEYFANMATTFLLGKSERPPYSCSIIGAAQPKFVSYLTSLFGPHACD